jgi:phage repressor protein C with HTH and peptisase S24 domain
MVVALTKVVIGSNKKSCSAHFYQSCDGPAMFRGDRLKALLAQLDISQSELARRVSVSPTAVWKLLNEPGQGSKYTHSIARELGTTPEYLMGETDDPTIPATGDTRIIYRAQPASEQAKSDTVELAEFNVAYGLGGSYIHDIGVKSRLRTFSREWIRQFSDSPFDNLFWATGNGISMMPAILEHDILLIDTMQNTPRMWDQFWAIDMHGMGMIKALRPTKDGGMRILSINPDWPEEVAYDGEMNIVGRVVAIVRKV